MKKSNFSRMAVHFSSKDDQNENDKQIRKAKLTERDGTEDRRIKKVNTSYNIIPILLDGMKFVMKHFLN